MAEYQLNTGKWSEAGSWGAPGKPSTLVSGDIVSILGAAEIDVDITIPFGVILRVTSSIRPYTEATVTGTVTLAGDLVFVIGDFAESYLTVTTGTFIFAQGSTWSLSAPEFAAGIMTVEAAGSLVVDSIITVDSSASITNRGIILCTSNGVLILAATNSNIYLERGYFILDGVIYLTTGAAHPSIGPSVSIGDCKVILSRADKILKSGYGGDLANYGNVIDLSNAYGLPTNDMIGG